MNKCRKCKIQYVYISVKDKRVIVYLGQTCFIYIAKITCTHLEVFQINYLITRAVLTLGMRICKSKKCKK